jgi:hypothetical protein
MYDGKKSAAEGIVYGAFDIIQSKRAARSRCAAVPRRRSNNVAPAIEVRSRRVGGATYQVPVEVRTERRQALAIRWIIDAARDAQRARRWSTGCRRAAGCGEQPRQRGEEARRHAPDGGSQPRLLALPLVIVSRCPAPTRI